MKKQETKFKGYKVGGVNLSDLTPIDAQRKRVSFKLTLLNLHDEKPAQTDDYYRAWAPIFDYVSSKSSSIIISTLSTRAILTAHATVKELEDWTEHINILVQEANKIYLDGTGDGFELFKQRLLNINFG